jgi:[ribosomal protein S18]-alanine N-acetyltransferase
VNFLELHPLTPALISSAIELDRRCLGGLWTRAGYERELESPNSKLLTLQPSTVFVKPEFADKTSSAFPNLQTSNPTQSQTPMLGLGCLWAILEEAHITILAIDPHYQRQGLGQALLYALLVTARHQKSEWATLEVRASNQSALTLYEKFGFETVGKRRRYYPDNGEDALILWHRGLQQPEFGKKLQDWRQRIDDRLFHSGWVWAKSIENLFPEILLDENAAS